MSKKYNNNNKNTPALPAALPSVAAWLAMAAFFLFTYLCSASTVKGTTVCLILAAVVCGCVFFRRLRERVTLPLLMLGLYVLMDFVSTFYAVSGKFALNEFIKVAASFAMTLLLLALTPGEGVAPGRRIAAVLTRASALAGLVSIDLLSTRWISNALYFVLGKFSQDYASVSGVEVGVRMTSMFKNPNVFAGMAGIGVLLALGLVLSSERGKERMGHVVCLFLNALSFVLAFSMGATVFVAAAFLVYLVLEFKERRAALFLLMVETLVVTLLCVVPISMTSLQAWDGFQPVPLLCVILGSAVLCLLDRYVGQPLAGKLAKHGKGLLIIIAALLAAAVAAVILAYNLTGPAALSAGESLRRSVYPGAGDYTVSAQVDGDVTVKVESQTRQETMMHTTTTLYQGDLDGAAFTVPEDSTVVYFNFTAPEGAVLNSVTVEGADGSGSVPLGYKLLPNFIANRIQGLFANQNAIQRLVFFEDGIKLFQRSPIVGLGMGSYENGIKSVQSFYYETKYAHNHYIQALTETGIIGLILFVGLLGVSAAAILLHRRKEGAHPLTPALGAALVFMAGHAAVEVVFSYFSYLPMAFGVFALIGLCCGKAIPTGWLSAKVKTGVLGGFAAVLLVFFFLLCGNLMAEKQVENSLTFDSLEQAIQLDKYEWADYMLSYVMSSPNASNRPEIQTKAEKYAARLETVSSNTIPVHLAQYYFINDNVERGMAMVEKYVAYVSSDANAWQSAFDLLEDYEVDSDAYRSGVAGIVDSLKEWNETNMGSITLSDRNEAFLERLGLM